jgi:putative nucleotidyltransferase with HDIG domain
MTKTQHIEELVRELYEARYSARDEWADWLYENHVLIVAEKARQLAQKYSIDEDLSSTAALLHDIADAEMSRFHNDHEDRSLEIARDFMKQVGYETGVIDMVVDDAIRFHSCRDGESPKTDVGRVLASADALAHLETDFYLFFSRIKGDQPLPEVKTLLRNKLGRDYNSKLMFDDEKLRLKPTYDVFTKLFS